MASIAFSQNILSHVEVEPQAVPADTVRGALEAVFALNPRLKGYLLDDDGAPRKHIAFIINGEPVLDRIGLTDAVTEKDDIFVMQALSGG